MVAFLLFLLQVIPRFCLLLCLGFSMQCAQRRTICGRNNGVRVYSFFFGLPHHFFSSHPLFLAIFFLLGFVRSEQYISSFLLLLFVATWFICMPWTSGSATVFAMLLAPCMLGEKSSTLDVYVGNGRCLLVLAGGGHGVLVCVCDANKDMR